MTAVMILCPKDVAYLLRCSERHARLLMSSNEIPSFVLTDTGRGWKTTRENVDEFIERRFQRYGSMSPRRGRPPVTIKRVA